MSRDIYAEAFGTLQQLLLVVNPESGEGAWQDAHAFEQLPEASRTPGHWYRGKRKGFIHVDEDSNGEFVKELPPDVDPASVVEIPATDSPTLLETMKSLLPNINTEQRDLFQTRMEELTRTAHPDHELTMVRNFREGAFAVSMSSSDTIRDYLAKSSEDALDEGLIAGRNTCMEAAALLLIHKLAEAIAPEGATAKRVLTMLAAPAGSTLEATAGQMVRNCVHNNFAAQVETVLTALLVEGDGLVAASREGFFPAGHVDLMLPLYYLGLYRASPYLRAAMIGYEITSLNPALSEEAKNERLTFANAVEEKLVRVITSIRFAATDLDGSRLRQKRAYIQSLLASGQEDQAYMVAMKAVDLNIFYPKPFKPFLLNPNLKP